MPYVNVPNDLSKIKTKIAFNLTRASLSASAARLSAYPLYLLTRHALGDTGAMFLMIAIMLPAFFMAMYERMACPLKRCSEYHPGQVPAPGVSPIRHRISTPRLRKGGHT